MKLSVTEYAKINNCSRTNILKKIKRNTLKHKFVKIGNSYIIYIPNQK